MIDQETMLDIIATEAVEQIWEDRKMTEQTRAQIIEDGLKNGLLIETCLGCGRPLHESDARLYGLEWCHDCPAGSGVAWNPKALEFIQSLKKK